MQVKSSTVRLSNLAFSATLLVGLAGQAQAITFSGTSSGEWGMPANPSGSTVISSRNSGTNNRLSWGSTDNCSACTPFNNYVQYDDVGFNAEVGSLFNVANFTYRNGSTTDGFNGEFPLDIRLSLTNPVHSSEAFNFSFNIFNTPNNTGNAVIDGDKLRFSGERLSSNTFNYDGLDYALELIGFSSDGGQTIVNEFNSPEGTIAYASLYSKIKVVLQPPQQSIPEPTTVLGLSLLGIYFATRRRKT